MDVVALLQESGYSKLIERSSTPNPPGAGSYGGNWQFPVTVGPITKLPLNVIQRSEDILFVRFIPSQFQYSSDLQISCSNDIVKELLMWITDLGQGSARSSDCKVMKIGDNKGECTSFSIDKNILYVYLNCPLCTHRTHQSNNKYRYQPL
jgi:hypothetical protein